MADQSRYEVGQVWKYQTRPGEESSTLVITRITPIGDQTCYSIFVENIHLVTDVLSGDSQDELPHAPMTADALDQSVTELVETRDRLPDFEYAYNEFMEARGGIFTISVSQVLDVIAQSAEAASNPLPTVGWRKLEGEEAIACGRELDTEIGPGHPLHGIGLVPVARVDAGDDLLVRLDETSQLDRTQCAEVHLTWSGTTEPMPWPTTVLFSDFSDWYAAKWQQIEEGREAASRDQRVVREPRRIAGLTPLVWLLLAILMGTIGIALKTAPV